MIFEPGTHRIAAEIYRIAAEIYGMAAEEKIHGTSVDSR